MQPKVGDKITAPNGSVWFVREGEKPNLLDNIKKVRGTNEWRPIKADDWVVTTGGLIRQVLEVDAKGDHVFFTSGTWDRLKTVDYISPNMFNLCEGDFVKGNGQFGVVKKYPDNGHLYVHSYDYKHRLSYQWKRIDTPVFTYKVLHSNTKNEKLAYYYRGQYYDCLTMQPLKGPVQRVQEPKPKESNPYVGKWFEIAPVSDIKSIPDVAVLCTEFENETYVLQQPNGHFTAYVCPPSMAKLEELRVEDHYLIGRTATFSKKTGKLLNQHDVFCGKWYEVAVHNMLKPMFCYDFRNGRFHLETVDKRTFVSMEVQNFCGHEELRIEGDLLVGKANTYDLETGGRVVMTVNADPSKMNAALEKTKSMLGKFQNAPIGKPLSMDAVMKAVELSEKLNSPQWLGPPPLFSEYKAFTEQALQAVVSQFSIPMKLWLPSEETTLPHCSFHNPHKIKPTSEMPGQTHFSIGGIPGCNFQHVYMGTSGGCAIRTNVGEQPVKKLSKEQLKNAKFLKLHLATIRTKKKLHWALENVENIYTNVFQSNRCAHGCRVQYLEIEGRICKNYVAIWQDKNFLVLPVDSVIGKLYYFTVVT